jgi:hypothetical protein
MLSTLPKLADRRFVIGFFLPALLFTLAGLKLFEGQPSVGELLKNVTTKDLPGAVFLLVGVWVLGVILLVLNHPLYRALEETPCRKGRRASGTIRTLGCGG